MTDTNGAARLYTTEILALAVELAKYPMDPSLRLQGSARSQSCGSTLDMGLDADQDLAISRLGMTVSACAIGQASAAIFARHAVNKHAETIERALADIEAWLAESGPAPNWPDVNLLSAARAYPARHGAILLPWRAAMAALSKVQPAR